MSTSDVFVGIDLSKSVLEVGVLPRLRTWKLSYDEWGLTELVKRLAALRPRLVVVEGKGKMAPPVQNLLIEAGLSVSVVTPGQMRDFVSGLGGLKMTRGTHALVLAQYGQTAALDAPCEGDKEAKELEAILVRRCQLVEMLTTEKDRLGTGVERVRGDIRAHIRWLKKCLNEIDKDTNGIIKSMPIWGQMKKVIQVVPGAGPIW